MPVLLSNPAIEFIRQCYIMISSEKKEFHRTTLIPAKKKHRMFCTCSPGTYPVCSHAKKLHALYSDYEKESEGNSLHDLFTNSSLYTLFNLLTKRYQIDLKTVRIIQNGSQDAGTIVIGNAAQKAYITYLANGDDRIRFMERIGTFDNENRCRIPRDNILYRGSTFVLTDTEKQLAAMDHCSSRMAEENNLWFRTAYHLFREYDETRLHPELSINRANGTVSVALIHDDIHTILHIHVPRKLAQEMIYFLFRNHTDTCGYTIDATEREIYFTLDTETYNHSTVITPVIVLSDEESGKNVHAFSKQYCYGYLVYNPEDNIFYTLSKDSAKLIAQHWDAPKKIHNNKLAAFIDEHADIFSIREQGLNHGESDDLFRSGPGNNLKRLLDIPVIKKYDEVKILSHALDRSWFYISVIYTFGTSTIPLTEFFKAREKKCRYLVTSGGLVDCNSPVIEDSYSAFLSDSTEIKNDGTIAVPRAAMMHLASRENTIVSPASPETPAAIMESMLHCRPLKKLAPLKGLKTTLRPYQKNGVSWLLFLFDNNFGGLLCDDMGLGKTHQIIGLITALKQQRKQKGPALIVCPTTVMYHWHNLITKYAPHLHATIYHGTERMFQKALPETDVFITSFGIMRQDIDTISSTGFVIAVFDEIQNLKNKDTLSFKAAELIRAHSKYGLSGTPIENSLTDLKALFDIVMPGYLGSDRSFYERFIKPIESGNDNKRRRRLHTIVNPFVLRRTKKSVLHELPPKIEDTRICRLSDEQAGMYRDTIKKRGKDILAQLKDSDCTIPYMHIFSLINFLKMVCNHPALALQTPDEYEKYISGKWDLFKEIIFESLASEQKVVVFTQYLSMIAIFEKFLTGNKIGYTTLTGSTTNRGAVIDRFTNDPACKVFVGSLKAGGVGIDLIAASVVIHYDRWWNAAREDQATDRVYRIGQTQGVQVIKLVTEGTLEEKIDAIIAKKKALASVISEDESDDIKIFSRDELISILDHSSMI